MNFPKYPINRMDIPVGVKDCVGFEPVEVYASLYDWIIVVAESEQDIRSSQPNFELINDQVEMKGKAITVFEAKLRI